jgi:hypothetical protein
LYKKRGIFKAALTKLSDWAPDWRAFQGFSYRGNGWDIFLKMDALPDYLRFFASLCRPV